MQQATDTRAVDHPAKFNDAIMAVIVSQLSRHQIAGTVLDPFAGVGGIHELRKFGYDTLAVEIEPEWAAASAERGPTECVDFFEWDAMMRLGAVVTSCTYGNRMADHHVPAADDTSKRITYRHSLGRDLTDGNSGAMPWGTTYRAFHIKAWIRVHHLLAGGGVFVLNVKNHIRKGEEVDVAGWHKRRVLATGFRELADIRVPVTGMGYGANGQLRIDHERVFVFERMRDDSKWNIEGQARREAKRDAGARRHVA